MIVHSLSFQTYLTLDLGRKSEGWAAPEILCHCPLWLFTAEMKGPLKWRRRLHLFILARKGHGQVLCSYGRDRSVGIATGSVFSDRRSACCGRALGQLSKHFSESFLNSSHLCVPPVQHDWLGPQANPYVASSSGWCHHSGITFDHCHFFHLLAVSEMQFVCIMLFLNYSPFYWWRVIVTL